MIPPDTPQTDAPPAIASLTPTALASIPIPKLPNGKNPWKTREYNPMTLPRKWSGARIWREAFAVAKNAIRPTPTPIMHTIESSGDVEAVNIKIEKIKMDSPE